MRILKSRCSQVGFTLIELIIVILSILAVAAAPRFINISGDAHKATTAFEAASFRAGIRLVYSANSTGTRSGIGAAVADS